MHVSAHTGTSKGQQKILKKIIWFANVGTGDFPLMHLHKQRIRIHELLTKYQTLPIENCAWFIQVILDYFSTTVYCHNNNSSGCGTSNDIEHDQFDDEHQHVS